MWLPKNKTMKRKKENDDENAVEINSEAESTEKDTNNGNVENDAGTYEFGNGIGSNETSAQEVEADTVDVDEILKSFVGEDKQKKRGRKRKEENAEPETPIIPGALVIEMIDATAVGIVGIADSFISKNPIDPQLISLREEQKSKLEKLADAAVIELQKKYKIDPVKMFLLALGSMYTSNYIIIKTILAKEKRNGT